MRTRHMGLSLTAAASSVVALSLMSPTALAETDDPADPVEAVVVESYAGENEIDRAIATAEGSDQTVEGEVEFLVSQASQGNLIDESAVESAVVDDTAVVWESSVDVLSVQSTSIVAEDTAEQVEAELAIKSMPDPTADPAIDSISTGTGMAPVTGFGDNVAYGGDGCLKGTNDGNVLNTCYERWFRKRDGVDNADFWYYGRWATAAGKERVGPDMRTQYVDIRSRPWEGYRNRVLGNMTNWWPKAESSDQCKEIGSIGVDLKGISGNMPINNCSGNAPDPDVEAVKMSNKWDAGFLLNNRVETSDFAFTYKTSQGEHALIADWSKAKFCEPSSLINPFCTTWVTATAGDSGY